MKTCLTNPTIRSPTTCRATRLSQKSKKTVRHSWQSQKSPDNQISIFNGVPRQARDDELLRQPRKRRKINKHSLIK